MKTSNKAHLNSNMEIVTSALTLALSLGAAVHGAAAPAQGPRPDAVPGARSAVIPMDQIGAVAGKQYQGEGLAVAATPEGARLRCVFQKLEGEATAEGLWLTSTLSNAMNNRFRIMAVAVGRELGSVERRASGRPSVESTLHAPRLARTGTVAVDGQTVRWGRPGLTEEYSVSLDGVRQDFIVAKRLAGAGQLRVDLEVTGAQVEPLANGARLVLAGSGRKIAYCRLRATDARGRELPGWLVVGGGVAAAPQSAAIFRFTNSGALPSRRYARLAVVVQDAGAEYPVRIDPTFSDANWISLNPTGAGGWVFATAVDGAGNLYIGGHFSIVGNAFATNIAKWNGSSWSALGAGIGGSYDPYVSALAISGSDLYAGGGFATAGGVAATNIAKWDGSNWSALGSGMGGGGYYGGYYHTFVSALAVSSTNLYAGGNFTTAGGTAATNIAEWDGSSWSALGPGMNNVVHALAVLGSDVYAGGEFTTAGGTAANFIAKWNGSSWSALGSGMGSPSSPYVYALAVSGTNLYAGGSFARVGGSPANCIARWNGSSWSALGSGVGGTVYALAVSGSDVYAGGCFTTAGGSAANYIATWDGSSWSPLGSGMGGGTYPYVYALAVSSTNLYAGGNFTTAGGKVSAFVAEALIPAAGGRFGSLAYSPARGFGFTFSDGTLGQYYLIQTSPSLAEGGWMNWLGFTYTGPITLTDASAPAAPRKFYRAVWAP